MTIWKYASKSYFSALVDKIIIEIGHELTSRWYFEKLALYEKYIEKIGSVRILLTTVCTLMRNEWWHCWLHKLNKKTETQVGKLSMICN
jgi:hypothetical protein